MARQFLGFGTGQDGDKVVSSSADYDGANAGCSGTSGTKSLTLDAASVFSNGDIVLIHQSRGSGAGNWELNQIASGGGTTSLTLVHDLENTYVDSGADQAQIVEVQQYRSVKVNSSQSWNAPSWDGNKGGIHAFMCSGETVLDGAIYADGRGYRGGSQNGFISNGNQGEGTAGAGSGTNGSNGNGGGGGLKNSQNSGNSGAGGGHASAASNGPIHYEFSQDSGPVATGGSTAGSSDLVTCVFGGGGGGGGRDSENVPSTGAGGNGGGAIFVFTKKLTINSGGAITSNGLNGGYQANNHNGGGGGGAGGSVLIKSLALVEREHGDVIHSIQIAQLMVKKVELESKPVHFLELRILLLQQL